MCQVSSSQSWRDRWDRLNLQQPLWTPSSGWFSVWVPSGVPPVSVSQALQKHIWEQICNGCNPWLRGGCVTAILQPVCCLQEVTSDSAFGPVTVSFYVPQTPHRAWHIKQSSKQIGPRSAVEHTAEKGSELLGKLDVWPYTALVLLWLAEGSNALRSSQEDSCVLTSGGLMPRHWNSATVTNELL